MRAAPFILSTAIVAAAGAQMTFDSRLSELAVTSTGGGTRSTNFSGFADYYDRITFGTPEGVADQVSVLRSTTIFTTTLARGNESGPGEADATSALTAIFTTTDNTFWRVEGIHNATLGASIVTLTDLDSGTVLFSSTVTAGSQLLEGNGRLAPGRFVWSIATSANALGQAAANVSLFVVPTPGTIALLGLAAFLLRRSRKLLRTAVPA